MKILNRKEHKRIYIAVRKITLTICPEQERLDAGVVERINICAFSGLCISARDGEQM